MWRVRYLDEGSVRVEVFGADVHPGLALLMATAVQAQPPGLATTARAPAGAGSVPLVQHGRAVDIVQQLCDGRPLRGVSLASHHLVSL